MSPIVISKVSFYFAIYPKDLEHGYESNSVVLSDIPWKIKMKKRLAGDNKIFLDVCLICAPTDCTYDWTCEAYATVTLRSVDYHLGLLQKKLPKTQFSHARVSSTLLEFIDWAVLEGFARNDRLIFDVQMKADPKKYNAAIYQPVQQVRIIFRFTIDEVSKLGEKSTPLQDVSCTKFRIKIVKTSPYLCVCLRHEGDANHEHWMWNVKFGAKLLSFDKNIQPIELEFEKNFFYDTEWGYLNFTLWSNFMNPETKYVQNDKAIFEFDLDVDPPKPILSVD